MFDVQFLQLTEYVVLLLFPFDVSPEGVCGSVGVVDWDEFDFGFEAAVLSDRLIAEDLDEPASEVTAIEATPGSECLEEAFLHEVFGVGLLVGDSSGDSIEDR
ncbi:MAG: hypothetical protein ABIV13_01320 [Fimbriimonadales bacterium]